MIHRTTKAGLFFVGLLLFSGKLFYDLYGGATNGLNINIANDLINYWWPFLTYAGDSVRSGILPLWNPYTSIGNSVVGEIGAGLFHPTTWTIFIIDDIATALLVSQLLTVAISMTGAYLYARYLGLQWPARILCVALFGYTAFTESFSHSSGASSCWFPVILYCTHRCFDWPTLGGACCVAISLALCFFGGFANYFLYTCLIVGIYFGTLLVLSWPKHGFPGTTQRFGLMVVAVILMTGLVAIQFLPAYELSMLSVRSLDSTTAYNPDSWWENMSASLLFLNFLLPDHVYLFGNSLLKIDSGLFYLGGTLLLLPFAFKCDQLRRTAIALTASCVFILLLILSTQISALSFIQDLPIVGSLRMHARGMVYVEFLLILLAALGVSAIGSERATAIKSTGPIGNTLWALIPAGFAIAVSAIAMIVVQNVLSIAGLLLCAGLIIYYVMASSRISRPDRLAWFIVAIIVFDISIHRENRFLIPAFSNAENSFAEQSARDYRARGDHYRLLLVPRDIEDTYTLANFGLRLGIPNISSYDSLTLNRWRNFVRAMSGPERFDLMIAGSLAELFYGELGPQLVKQLLSDDRVLGMASVRYLYTQQDATVNEHALPRAYAVHHYIETDSEEQSLDAIKANIATLRESVILENAKPSYSPNDYPQGQGSSGESVLIKRYTPNEVELSVNVLHPAIVVLTDAFYPGWEAYIDGRKTEIFRANSLFRAVEVPSGNHSVVFHYRPTSLYLGAAISVLSLCLALFFMLLERHIRKYRKSKPGHLGKA